MTRSELIKISMFDSIDRQQFELKSYKLEPYNKHLIDQYLALCNAERIYNVDYTEYKCKALDRIKFSKE